MSPRLTHLIPNVSLMRFLSALLLCILTVGAAQAQDPRAVPLDRLEDFGVSIARLDSLHGPAVHADASLAVFTGRHAEVVEAWRALLGDLAAHLRAEGFEWSEPLRGYHRFYFDPDGRVDRVLYHVRDVDAARSERYGEILNAFARTYRFALSSDRAFSQCSPITLMPPAE